MPQTVITTAKIKGRKIFYRFVNLMGAPVLHFFNAS